MVTINGVKPLKIVTHYIVHLYLYNIYLNYTSIQKKSKGFGMHESFTFFSFHVSAPTLSSAEDILLCSHVIPPSIPPTQLVQSLIGSPLSLDSNLIALSLKGFY